VWPANAEETTLMKRKQQVIKPENESTKENKIDPTEQEALDEDERELRSLVCKHSIKLRGGPTTISLENESWAALQEIAKKRETTLGTLITTVAAGRSGNRSSALRVFALEYYRDPDSIDRLKTP
jgi:predicted DNA-binding ribbon-helix-helix protein